MSGAHRPQIELSPTSSPLVKASSVVSSPPSSPNTKKTHVSTVLRLLLNFAAFINRAKGDVEGAFIIYRKAYRIDETNPKVLAHFAHFLAEEGGDLINSPSKNSSSKALGGRSRSQFSTAEAERLFELALRSNPKDAMIAMWYAKLLRKAGKLGQVL